jgi:hypothetical protein
MELLFESFAVHVTTVLPIGNWVPDGLSHVGVIAPSSASCADAL